MAYSYATLEQEAVWREQFTPDALEFLGESLRTRYNQTRSSIGSAGDNNHLRGGHRSRDWILRSSYCTNRTYTVTHADDLLGDKRWYCAIDIGGMSQAELIAMCKRLDVAVRAGLLEECWEWYGNLGGDDRVDGWNNLENRLASSDSSHLDHLHMTFRRRYANDMNVMRRALAILTGDDMSVLVRLNGDPKVFIGDGITRRHVASPAELTALKAAAKAGHLNLAAAGAVLEVASLAPYGADITGPAVPADLTARLDAILAAALDDGDTTVVLDPAALAEVQAIRADMALLPAATADLVHADLAD